MAFQTSRLVFDDPVDRERYRAQEYDAIVSLGRDAPAGRVLDWRRYCWHLASLDGFPESYVCATGEIVGGSRDAWTKFARDGAAAHLADAMANRAEFARDWRLCGRRDRNDGRAA